MWSNFLFALFIFAPAGLANLAPIIVSKLPVLKNWNYPMDFYKEVRGIRIFGDHKTIRGLLCGILVAVLVSYFMSYCYQNSSWMQSQFAFDYHNSNPLILGLLSGFGALMGDAIKSFFKRRTNIKPGATWFPFDQIDYIIGGLIMISLYMRLSLETYFWVLLAYFGLHLFSTYLGFLLKLKKQPI